MDDSGRSPISVDVYNPGPGPMELAVEIGPEVWLEPLSGWNDTAIPPSASRTVQLRTRRNRALAGSAFPRSTYFTVRTRDDNRTGDTRNAVLTPAGSTGGSGAIGF